MSRASLSERGEMRQQPRAASRVMQSVMAACEASSRVKVWAWARAVLSTGRERWMGGMMPWAASAAMVSAS